MRSLIPRVVTPPALRKMYPRNADKLATPDRNVVRKKTYNTDNTGVSNPELEQSKAISTTSKIPTASSVTSKLQSAEEVDSATLAAAKEDEGNLTDEGEGASQRLSSSSGFPLPGAALFTPISPTHEDSNRTKVEPSKEMRAALKVLNDSFKQGTSSRPSSSSNSQVTNAVNIVQQEWFKTSSTKQSEPLMVEDYLDSIEDMSKELLNRVVNMTDVNGNTALHYSVSHGNFNVVSVLLDSKVANPNILNKAGYTSIMLIALAAIKSDTHRAVIARLFSLGDVNTRASQHGQTALMLAVSHGRLDMVKLLVEAGADVNVRDEDGSTALMCAAEHGSMEIVKYLMAQPDTNVNAKDNDGLTALSVAMEAGHRDVGVILYAGMSFSRGASPYSSLRIKRGGAGGSQSSSRTNTPPVRGAVVGGQSANAGQKTNVRSPVTPQPPSRTRRNSSNQ